MNLKKYIIRILNIESSNILKTIYITYSIKKQKEIDCKNVFRISSIFLLTEW
ncbi:hypothetical protein GCM10007380_14980 [Gottfriedia solisilvae]|uniref:Uncharacterized protein n=1 Tax=Gottfriedia solisilvae TaxID=1516104 RepID=A0A8J3ALE5_9BACI|nr:hypothetical protein GCM10007380_14980 [Gottfriedia solisilvae]